MTVSGIGMMRFGKSLDRGIPTNTSVSLLSKGHPIGATGSGQLVERLRGRAGERQARGARMALAENGGGYLGKDPTFRGRTSAANPKS